MAGGIVWGGFTSAWIALGWILMRRPGRRWMNNRYAVNLLFGKRPVSTTAKIEPRP